MVGAFHFAVVAGAGLVASTGVSASPSFLRHGARSQPSPNGAAGAVVAISQSGLDFVCQQVLEPMLENELDDLTFDDIDTEKDGIKIHIDNLRTHDFKCDDCLKAALVSGSGLQVDLKNFELELHWRYTLKKIITTGGECETKLTNADLNGLITLGLSSDGHPTLDAQDINAAIEDLDLGCDGLSGSILDALSSVFKDKVVKAVSDAAKGALVPAIQSASKSLQKVDLDIPITNNFAEVRFELSTEPNITASWITVEALGTVAPVADPGQVAPYAVPDLPGFDSSEQSYVQVLLSDYTFNSAAYTYWKAGRLVQVVTPEMIPSSFPIQLNTSSLAIVAPGLAEKYPTPVPVQVLVEADPLTKPQVDVHADGLIVSLPSLMSFQPIPQAGQPAVDGFTVSCPVTADATLTMSDQNVAGNLSNANCSLTEYNSTVGQIDVATLNTLTQYTLGNIVLPQVNKIANAGLPIPSVENYELSNSRVKLFEHYALVATDFKHS